ncbi:MAG: glycosyltransferase family 39 protein [Verrucomicrobia bacterium]|nr:glycosyltransferase family 39 protein [Verrucomicrobiota bacterium]
MPVLFAASLESSPQWWPWLLLPAVIFAGYFGPGYLLSRQWSSPAPVLSAFLGSCVALFYTVLLLDACDIPASRGAVAALLVVICLGIFWLNRRLPKPPSSMTRLRLRLGDLWWLFPVLCGLAAIVGRAWIEPLSGYDNGFRWDYIAHLLVRQGDLHFYPPVTAADFDLYAWCDGIPPLVPVLNFWIYLGTGSEEIGLTVARVAIEAGLLFYTVFLLGKKLWGAAGGQAAIAALSTSSLLLWGVAMGQETGLTALGMAAMLYFITEYEEGKRSVLLWAGIAAGVAGLSREYALAFPLIGLLALRWKGASWRSLALFGFTAWAIAAPWYVRNALHTGNPLYSQSVGGLFPVNAAYAESMSTIASFWSVSAHWSWLGSFGTHVAALAGMALVLGVAGAVRAGSRSIPFVAAMLLTIALWLWSLSQTAGGWIYAMRVLTPCIAVAAALAGWIGTIDSRRWKAVLALLLSLVAVDATRRAWLLPVFPMAPILPYDWQVWKETRLELYMIRSHKVWDVLAFTMGNEGIAVDHPAYHAELTRRGALAIPFFSPRVAPFYDRKLSWSEALAALRHNRVRLVVVTQGRMSSDFMNKFPFLHRLRTEAKPVAEVGSLIIYDLTTLAPPPPLP